LLIRWPEEAYVLTLQGSIPSGDWEFFFFATASRLDLETTQTLIQWVPGALSLGVKRTGSEADHSPPSRTEVKECVELYLHFPNTPSWRGAQLKKKAHGQLYLYIDSRESKLKLI
jgi:hypothetical protein